MTDDDRSADLPAGQGLAGKLPGACTCTPGSVDVGCPVHFPQADPIANESPRRSSLRRARLALSYSRLSQEAKDLMRRVLHGYHERSGAHPRTGSAAEVEAIAAGCLTADDHCVWVVQEVCDLIPGPRDRLTLNTEDERQVWLAVFCSEASSGAADDAVRAYRQRLPSYQQAASSFARDRYERLSQAPADSRRGGDDVVDDVREGFDAETPTGPGWWWVWSATHPDGYGWVPVYVSCLGRDLVWQHHHHPKHFPVEQYEWGGRCVRRIPSSVSAEGP